MDLSCQLETGENNMVRTKKPVSINGSDMGKYAMIISICTLLRMVIIALHSSLLDYCLNDVTLPITKPWWAVYVEGD